MEGLIFLKLFAVFFLVFLNALFVAAEFAFVRIRSTQVEALVAGGRMGAGLVKEATGKLDTYLAVSQLGITIASLGLGWIGEPAVSALINPLLGPILPEAAVHEVALVLGFTFITFLHVVLGELVPKTLSIQKAEAISLMVAPIMKFFYYLFMPGIIVFNGTANLLTRLVGVAPASENRDSHTQAEIRSLIAHSREEGILEENQEDMIEGVFDLGDTIAREIMVARPDVVTVPADAGLNELLTIVTTENYTRYPVFEKDLPDRIIGAVHAKDMLRVIAKKGVEAQVTARDLMRDVLVVPENRRIDDLLADFQGQEIQLAIVIDEWGSFEGIVTIEDVLEEIVGEIRDEFDEEEPAVRKMDEGVYAIDGRISLEEVNDVLGSHFESKDFGTMGGLILGTLGRPPAVGDEIQLDGYCLRVEEVDGARVAHVVVQRHELPEVAEIEQPASPA